MKHRTPKEICSALSENRIVPFFQPIYDASTSKIAKYESLVRMLLPDGEVVSPFFFLSVAQKEENKHLYFEITKVMISESIRTFATRKEDFSVNLTLSDIDNPEVTKHLFTELTQNPGVEERLIVEITETESTEESKELASFVDTCKQSGIRLSIDDFGSGYSNFANLINFKYDFIKIDGSIVKEIVDDIKSRRVVEKIAEIAVSLGAKTVAEYVANEKIASLLKEMDIDYLQGFYLGEPSQELD